MTLGFTVVGYIIMVVFYAIAAVVLAMIWIGIKPWPRARWVVIIPLALVALVLPWADELWISWHFSELCKDAGVHVTRKVEVEGYLEDISRSSAAGAKVGLIDNPQAIEEFDKAGFRFKEFMLKEGKVWHLERTNGGLQATILDRPAARYHYKFADPRQEVPIGLKLEKRETIVVDSEAGEVIARDTHYNRYPGWLDSLWVRFFGTGQVICKGSAPKPPELRHLLYHYVLIPATQH